MTCNSNEQPNVERICLRPNLTDINAEISQEENESVFPEINILGGSQCFKKNHREEQMGGADEGNGGSRTWGYCMNGSLSATESFQSSLTQQDTMTSVS